MGKNLENTYVVYNTEDGYANEGLSLDEAIAEYYHRQGMGFKVEKGRGDFYYLFLQNPHEFAWVETCISSIKDDEAEARNEIYQKVIDTQYDGCVEHHTLLMRRSEYEAMLKNLAEGEEDED